LEQYAVILTICYPSLEIRISDISQVTELLTEKGPAINGPSQVAHQDPSVLENLEEELGRFRGKNVLAEDISQMLEPCTLLDFEGRILIEKDEQVSGMEGNPSDLIRVNLLKKNLMELEVTGDEDVEFLSVKEWTEDLKEGLCLSDGK
jgi:hypothetical protein